MNFKCLFLLAVLVFGSSDLLFSQIKVSRYDVDFQIDL